MVRSVWIAMLVQPWSVWKEPRRQCVFRGTGASIMSCCASIWLAATTVVMTLEVGYIGWCFTHCTCLPQLNLEFLLSDSILHVPFSKQPDTLMLNTNSKVLHGDFMNFDKKDLTLHTRVWPFCAPPFRPLYSVFAGWMRDIFVFLWPVVELWNGWQVFPVRSWSCACVNTRERGDKGH